jgi:hypothetical protein
MFELHVVVAAVVMFNILELIMEIVPNFPTHTICFSPEKQVREEVVYVVIGVLLLRRRKVLSDPLHLLGVAIEQSRSGTLYTLLPPSLSCPLSP